MNHFIFKEKSSKDIKGLLVVSLPMIVKPPKRVENIEIEGRDGDINIDLGYQSYDKTLSICILNNEVDINELINWLDGSGILVLSNEPDKYYEAEIIEEIDFDRLFKFEPTEIVFHCQPFKYLKDEKTVSIEYIQTEKSEDIIITDATRIYGKINVEGNTKQDTEPTITNPAEMKNCNNAINIKIKNKNIFGKGLSTPKENKKFWETIGSDVSALEDGWARFTFNNSSTSTRYVNAFSKFSLFRNIIKANTNYKIITEFRNVQIDDNDNASYFCLSSNYANECFTKNISYYKDKLKTAKQIETLSTKANLDNVVVLFRNFLAISPGHTVSLEVRICVTEDLETENFIEPEEKIISFPLTKGQVLRKGDYLASDGIHHKRKRFALDGTDIWQLGGTGNNTINQRFYLNKNFLKSNGDLTCNYFKQVYKGSIDIFNNDVEGCNISNGQYIQLKVNKEIASTLEELHNWIRQKKNEGNPLVFECELDKEEIEEYTEEQKNMYNELQNVSLYQGYNYISSEDEVKPIIQLRYISNEKATITNKGLKNSKPILKIFGNGEADIYLNGIQIFKINIDDKYIIVDSKQQDAYKEDILKNRQMQGNFPELLPGENIITWDNNITKIEVLANSCWL